MRVRVRRGMVAVLVAGLLGTGLAVVTPGGSGAATTATSDVGRVPAVVSFIGDLNVTLGSRSIALALTQRDRPYAFVDLARSGAAIRSPDCPWSSDNCATHDFWKARLADANAKIASDAYVVDLGLNDTGARGTATGPGYAEYPAKIDWLMSLLGGKPVFWTTLPCLIEPARRAAGCYAVNEALRAAPVRWPNLTVIEWAHMANSHPEYMSTGFGGVVYQEAGSEAWAAAVAAALDAKAASFSSTGRSVVHSVPSPTAVIPGAGDVPAAITFVGDSNITLSLMYSAIVLTQRDRPYAMVDLARSGAAIRSPDCPWPSDTCPTNDFWKARLADANARVGTDAYVVDLGINDTATPGTATTQGYADYPAKIDWLMALMGGKRVLWTNLPCSIEPAARAVGCAVVNGAIDAAPARWPNLTVIDWESVATGHPEYMMAALGGVHYTAAGNLAWAATAAGALDATFHQSTPVLFGG